MKKKHNKKTAVALKYEPGKSPAPRVTAKGQGEIAEKIIALAKKHNITIKDDPDLVEVLSQVDLNKEIPPLVYKVVAEIFSFVYSVNDKELSRM